jgi:sugar phosphate isomerase/epimerase
MPPVEFIEMAASLDLRWVGLGLTPLRYYNPYDYPDWSLSADPDLRRETIAAMKRHGVGISLMEGFLLQPGADFDVHLRNLDIVAGMGVRRISAMTDDRDAQRSFDAFALIAEHAEPRGIEVTIELGPAPIKGIAGGLAAMRHVGRSNFRLLIDTMHYFRRGGSMAELAETDPAVVSYVQLCDAPLVSPFTSYMEEALHERIVPGAGALPLREFLAWLPQSVIVSVEVPQRSRVEAGIDPRDRVKACLDGARSLFSQ